MTPEDKALLDRAAQYMLVSEMPSDICVEIADGLRSLASRMGEVHCEGCLKAPIMVAGCPGIPVADNVGVMTVDTPGADS